MIQFAVHIRIYIFENDVENAKLFEQYLCNAVPREGETYYVQSERYLVDIVEWTHLPSSHKTCADVYLCKAP